MKNKYRSTEDVFNDASEEQSKKTSQREKKRPQMTTHSENVFKRIGRGLGNILGGSILSKREFLLWMPFIFLLFSFAIIYIFNNYYAEKNMIKLERTKRELTEFRHEYISTKSDMMDSLRESTISSRLSSIGILDNNKPPIKLVYQPDSVKNVRR